MRFRSLCLAALLLGAAPAAAATETIFEDDFQDGEADGWGQAAGEVRLTTYAGNVSMRLTQGGVAVLALDTSGYSGIAASGAFAALSLGRDGRCVAEVSADDGTSWTAFHAIGKGQDDGVTLHRGETAVPALDDKPRILIRLSVQGGGDATCWADDIRITGTPKRGAVAPAAGEDGPVDTASFTPPADARPPAGRLEGELTLSGVTVKTRLLTDLFRVDAATKGSWKTLPDFAFSYVQDGARLIPARRGPIANAHPDWEFVLEPGAVWTENGVTRVALPFSLQERNANCLHNGLLAFTLDAAGKASRARLQIGSETCLYFKFDLWGAADATFRAQKVSDAAALVAADRAQLKGRLPVRPISDLVARHPQAAGFGTPAEVKPENMTSFGVVVDGVFYVGGCGTRYGAHPFCAELSLPSYSTAKTLVGGIGLMRLEALHPGAARAIVADYVPACAKAGNWGDVSFVNALDMATGNYTSDGNQVDEDSEAFVRFVTETTHAAKIALACASHDRRAPPGTRWVYHTSDTYILGAAMAGFLAKHGGGDMFDTLVAPVWRALGVSPAALVTRRTYDAARQPFTGWGITFQRDDFAKLGLFMARGDGVAGGKAMIDAAMLKAALQRDPSQPGLTAASDDLRYQHGMWAWNAAKVLGCRRDTWIPFMAGYGGILVALMPNGMVYVRVSDGGDIPWAKGAAAADAIKPFCER